MSTAGTALFLLCGLLVNVNPTTLHCFYRDQLAPMWLVPRNARHWKRLPVSSTCIAGKSRMPDLRCWSKQ